MPIRRIRLQSDQLPVAIGAVVLVLAYLTARLIGVGDSTTTDEIRWMARSANFYQAWSSGDLQYTFQFAHPGVITTWAGMLGYLVVFPDYPTVAGGQLTEADFLAFDATLRSMGKDPMAILTALRISKIFLSCVFYVVSLALLRRFVPWWTVAIIGVLLAFSPFTVGLDGVLHVDALFGIIAFAAILAIGAAAFTTADTPLSMAAGQARTGWQNWAWWVLAGVLSAMAWLNRSTGLVLVGVVVAALLLGVGAGAGRGIEWRTGRTWALRRGGVWAAAAAVTSVTLLPALLVTPGKTLVGLWEFTASSATEGHEVALFYRGIRRGAMSPLFYPESVLWRTTPTEWVGLLLLLVGIVVYIRRAHRPSPALAMVMLISLAFVVVYLVGMTAGAKKFDRYLVPVYPVLVFWAGLGLAWCLRWAREHPPRVRQGAALGLVVLVVVQIGSWVSSLPYKLDYFNPLLGGTRAAEKVFQLGWGQGGKDVVDHLVAESADEPVTARVGRTAPMDWFLAEDSDVHLVPGAIRSPAAWLDADYVVVSLQDSQRRLDVNGLVVEDLQPSHETLIGGVAFFSTYDIRGTPLPELLASQTPCSTRMGPDLQLVQIVTSRDGVALYVLSGPNGGGDGPVDIDIDFPDISVRDSTELIPAGPGEVAVARVPKPELWHVDHRIQVTASQGGEELDVDRVGPLDGEQPMHLPDMGTEPVGVMVPACITQR